jgi:UDP-galactopyranose mutase
MTLYQLWGVSNPQQAKEKIDSVRIKNDSPKNLEEWIVSEVGEELYETFVKGYTSKQWNKDPKDLPSFIIKRLPIRMTYDDRYFNDKYQGIPTDGYTRIFENMLDHENIKVSTDVDFFKNKKELGSISRKIVYTGKIDEFYDYRFGRLEYRSLRFESKVLDGDHQGCGIINYTEKDIPFTRVVEHKHFELKENKKTVVTWEFPKDYSENETPYYPINDEKNNLLYNKYKELNSNDNVIFGGRLGKYQYMDMHQIIGSAIKTAEESVLNL